MGGGRSAGGHFEPAGGRQVSAGLLPKRTVIESMPRRNPDDSALLTVQVYKTLSDAVVFDWFISLNDKDRMSECDVAYAKVGRNESSAFGLSPFLPRHRSFVLPSLEAETTYEFHMSCDDRVGRRYATNAINFTTGAYIRLD